MTLKPLYAAALGAVMMTPSLAAAQQGRAVVSIYHAAPGQQLALMKFLADQDRVAAAAGVAKPQVYVHEDGADWDYLTIGPATTPAQDAALEAAGKRLGIDAGPRSALEFRKYIMNHTDTLVRGPMTAGEYVTSMER